MNNKIFAIIRFFGIPFLIRNLLQKNRVTIVLFHDLSIESAQKSINYLNRKYNIISLELYLKARIDINYRSKIPKKALIITFDDGHIGNYNLLPFLKKNNIPSTIFLCSSLIDTNRHFWFKFEKNLDNKSKIKRMSNESRLTFLSEKGFTQDKEYLTPHALQKHHVFEMKPFINFQSHTMYHPILPMLSYNEAKKEIFGSKEWLEKEYGLQINAIAYPNGDYSDRDIQLAKMAGYKCGLTVDFGFNSLDTDLFKLKRLSLNDSGNVNEVSVKSSGIWAYLKSKKNGEN